MQNRTFMRPALRFATATVESGGSGDETGTTPGQGDDPAGEAGAGDDDTGDSGADASSDDDEGADQLGDAGKQALSRMKEKLRAERTARRQAEQKLNDATAKDDEDAERRQIETEALTRANTRIVKAELKAAAAGKLADPTDASHFIDIADFEVDDDGNVDEDEIASAIDDLITRKPHLAAQGGTKGPKPDRSQGNQGNSTATTAQQFAAAIDQFI